MNSEDKIIIYTCITSDYDNLREPLVKNDRFKFVYFSPHKMTDETSQWEHRSLTNVHLNNLELSRLYKIKPHIIFPDCTYCLYMDANLQITDSCIYEEVINHINNGVYWVGINHAIRDCVYEEGFAVVASRKADYFKVKRFLRRLIKMGFPKHYGMTENNFILRNIKNTMVIDICNKWWELFMDSKTQRDQLSLPVIFWQEKFHPIYFFNGLRSWSYQGIERYIHTKDKQETIHKRIKRWLGYYKFRIITFIFGPIR